MAVEQGTASGHVDLLDKLITFLTTDATLVGLSQNWTLLDSDVDGSGGRLMRGQGLGSSDEINIVLNTGEDVDNDYYYLEITGVPIYNTDTLYVNLPGKSSKVYMHSWNQSIPYWFIADGRHFKVISKISTTYHSMYGGFYLPFYTPSEFPHPLMVAGNTNLPSRRWSTTSYEDSNFWNPGQDTFYVYNSIDNLWEMIRNHDSSSGNVSWRYGSSAYNNVKPWCNTYGQVKPYNIRSGMDGSYTLLPNTIRIGQSHVFGQIPGLYFISGFANASENDLTIGGKQYLVFQDIDRTGLGDYAAFLWE